MSVETWLAFAAASMLLVAIPGPTVVLVLSYALGQGWRAALPVALGVVLGDATAMTVSLLGLGAVLRASALLFTALKWSGGAYLVWLGIGLWRSGPALKAQARTDRGPASRMVWHAWLVTTLNPKSITFFVAFLPQFLDARAPLAFQFATLEFTFLLLAFANALLYAAAASRIRTLVGNPRAVRWLNRAGGSLLIGAGAATVGLGGG